MKLETILDSLRGDELRKIIQRLSIPSKGLTAKLHFSRVITEIIRNRPHAFLAALDEADRNLLAEIAHTGDVPSGEAFQAKYGMALPLVDSRWRSRDGVSPMNCLIYTDFTKQTRFVCDEAAAFRELVSAPSASSVETAGPLPQHCHERPLKVFAGAESVFLELGRVLRLVQSGKVKVTEKSGRPTDASCRQLGQALIGEDLDLTPPSSEHRYGYEEEPGPVRAHAWGVLVQQCGWAKARACVLKLTEAGKSLLTSPNADAFASGVESFLSDPDFDELNRVNYIRGQTGKAKRWMTDPGERRESVAQALGKLPVGEWVHFDIAYSFTIASGGDFKVGGESVLYIADAHYGQIYESRDLKRQYFRALLMESFATLGLVDIAYVSPHGLWPDFADSNGYDALEFLGRYDGLESLRLTPLGAFCMGTAETFELPSTGNEPVLQVLKNFDIAVLSTADPGTLAMLEMVALRQSDAVWKLDGETLLRAVEAGTPWRTLREMLAGAVKGELPSNVNDWFASLEAKAARCSQAHPAVIFEWIDEAEAIIVANSPGIAPLCYHAGGNRLVVPRKSLAAFTRAARKCGYLLPISK